MKKSDEMMRSLRGVLELMRDGTSSQDGQAAASGLRLIKAFMKLSDQDRQRVIDLAEKLGDQSA
jgi:hypothetical protein